MASGVRFLACLLLAVVFVGCFHDVEGYSVCKRKTFLQKIRFTCPEPGQPSDMIYCCGDDDDIGGQYCCRSIINDKTIEAFANNIGSIIATIAGIIGFLIILLIICCCVCPCCLLYKRRTNGRVFRSTTVPATNGSSGVNVTVVPPPSNTTTYQSGPPPAGFVPQVGGQGGAYPMQPMYPNLNQSGGYPPQQAYYPAQPGYPPQPAYYADQPPPYPHAGTQEAYQKQSPYNPTY